MFKQNKDLYNRYIYERNELIKNRNGATTNIEEFLKKETIKQKYFRFFTEFGFYDDTTLFVNKQLVNVPGFTKFIFPNDKYEEGNILFREFIDKLFTVKFKYIRDYMEQYIEEYNALRYDLDYIIEKQYDDDYIVYMLGYYSEKYIKTFNIIDREDLEKIYTHQITSYLNYIGLTVDEL